MSEFEAMLVSAAIEGPIAFGVVYIMRWHCRGPLHAAIAQPAPVKKPTQNQTPIWWRLMVEGMSESPCGDPGQ
jgi:hypothetical protein